MKNVKFMQIIKLPLLLVAVGILVLALILYNNLPNRSIVNDSQNIILDQMRKPTGTEEVSNESGQQNVSGDQLQGETRYVKYSESLLKSNYRKVLFFSADWCASCQQLHNDILQNSSDIPDDMYIMEVDFDNNRKLVSDYGIDSEHSIVEIDNEGNLVGVWQDLNDYYTLNALLLLIDNQF